MHWTRWCTRGLVEVVLFACMLTEDNAMSKAKAQARSAFPRGFFHISIVMPHFSYRRVAAWMT